MDDLVRIVHIRHFDTRLGRFQSTAFKSDKGVSVFVKECAERASASTCKHINRFYPTVASAPPLYAVVPRQAVPITASVITTRSKTDDECHRDILNLSRDQSRSITKGYIDGNVKRCDSELLMSLSELTDARLAFDRSLQVDR
jgi:hypothetical protein